MQQKIPRVLKDRCLIDGQWVGMPVHDVINPATGDRRPGGPGP